MNEAHWACVVIDHEGVASTLEVFVDGTLEGEDARKCAESTGVYAVEDGIARTFEVQRMPYRCYNVSRVVLP